MPAYCTHGMLLRAHPQLKDKNDYAAFADIRERAMARVDGMLEPAIKTPLNPWVRVTAVDGSDVTVAAVDVGYISAGDTVVWYDNTSTVLAVGGVTTASAVSGATVTLATPGDIAEDDELAVVSEHETSAGRTIRVFGPPQMIHAAALTIAKCLTLEEVIKYNLTEHMQDEWEATIADLKRWGSGKGNVWGASYRNPCKSRHIGLPIPMDVDHPKNWRFPSSLQNDIIDDRTSGDD